METIVDIDRILEDTYTEGKTREKPSIKPHSQAKLWLCCAFIVGALATFKFREEIKDAINDKIEMYLKN